MLIALTSDGYLYVITTYAPWFPTGFKTVPNTGLIISFLDRKRDLCDVNYNKFSAEQNFKKGMICNPGP